MRKECNGLYLCEVPTGIGKSYQAAHAMEEYVKEIREEYAKAMRQCARTITDERKLIYLTPLRKNVGEEEEELKKAYENEELFEKEVLHIKSNVDNIIENLGKVTIPQDKQPFNYDELKKQVKAYNGEPSPEIKKIWEDKVEEEERKFRKEIKNTLSVIPARERLERIKNVILEFCTWYSNSTSFWKNTGRKEVFVRYCVGSPSESNWFRGGYEYILYTEKWVF